MRLKINYKIITAFIVLSVCCAPTTDAQIWKRLKKKAKEKLKKTEDKLLDKLEKKTDKVIDSTLEGKGEKKRNIKPKNFKSYGSVSIDHSVKYGLVNIDKLTQTKVNKSGNEFRFTGNWISSTIDVFDGYYLTVNAESINELNRKRTFNIPAEAELRLGYDPIKLGTYSGESSGEGQTYDVEEGTVTIIFNKDQNVEISFSGNATLTKAVKKVNAIDEYDYIKTPVIIKGAIKTKEPKYSITKASRNTNKKNNSKISQSDKKTLLEELSPTVNIPSSFSFNKNIEVEITNNRGEKYSVNFLTGNYPDIYGMSVVSKEMQGQGQVTMVMTPKSSTMFMNMAGMKMKKSTTIDQLGDQYNMSDKLPDASDFGYVKTGRTKTIIGYNCEEYKVEYDYTNSKGSASFWVSKDFPIQNMELPMMGMKLNNPYLSGFVLELNSNHQGQSMTMKVTKVSNESLTINSSDYKKAGF